MPVPRFSEEDVVICLVPQESADVPVPPIFWEEVAEVGDRFRKRASVCMYLFLEEVVEVVRSDLSVIKNGIMSASDPEVLVDQVSNLSSSKEAVLFLSFHFLQNDLFLEAGIMDDSVQC